MSPVRWGTVDVAEIPQYTDEEAEATWWGAEELETIGSTMWDTVSKFNQEETSKNPHAEDEYCIRGLEDMTVRGSIARLVAKYSMDLAVLEEQKIQKEKGIRDEEALARASRVESERYVNKAIEFGKKDQESANIYLNRAQEPSTAKPPPAEKQPWFRRESWKRRESKKHPGVRIGLSVRRIFGMKRTYPEKSSN